MVKYHERQLEIERLSKIFVDSLNIPSEVLDEIRVEHVESYDWYELKKL